MQPKDETISNRKAGSGDAAVIREMLYHAIFVPPGSAPPPRDVIQAPDLARYYAGWGRRDDLGWIAEADGGPVGAVWQRMWKGPDRGYGFMDESTPELSIAVLPPYRGRGIGGRLMELFLQDVRDRYPRISLSVTKSNPARRLYARVGFREVAEEGDSVLMVLLLEAKRAAQG